MTSTSTARSPEREGSGGDLRRYLRARGAVRCEGPEPPGGTERLAAAAEGRRTAPADGPHHGGDRHAPAPPRRLPASPGGGRAPALRRDRGGLLCRRPYARARRQDV